MKEFFPEARETKYVQDSSMLYLGKLPTTNFNRGKKQKIKSGYWNKIICTNECTFTSEIFLPGFLLEFEFSWVNCFILCILLNCFRANHPRITAGTNNENIVSNRQRKNQQ